MTFFIFLLATREGLLYSSQPNIKLQNSAPSTLSLTLNPFIEHTVENSGALTFIFSFPVAIIAEWENLSDVFASKLVEDTVHCLCPSDMFTFASGHSP